MSNKSVAEIHLNSTKHGLDVETRQSVVELLNARLADVIDLELQAKQAHWNVKGPNFIGLHELFDEVSAAAAKYKDEIAERAVMLGGVAVGTAQAVVERTTLRAVSGRSAGLEEPRGRACRRPSRSSGPRCVRPSRMPTNSRMRSRSIS